MQTRMKRAGYIDNLRTMVIALVIMLHLAVTYSSLGRWYYNENIAHDFFGQVFFATFQTIVQAFSMGLMFLLAGYFTPASFDKKGFGKFIIDRFKRLGIPALFYFLVITPFVVWIMVPAPELARGVTFGEFYTKYIISAGFKLSGMGPMWFAVALFCFSLFYALARRIRPRVKNHNPKGTGGTRAVLAGLIVVIAAGAFMLRLVFPIGTIFWGMQLCFFSQYVIMFIAGILAYRRNYFERITPAAGKKWLAWGLIAGTASLVVLRTATGVYDLSTYTLVLNPGLGSFSGGASWKAISFALWESFVAVAISAGLITLFRERLNFSNPLVKNLSASSFTVYMFHPPIIIAVTLALQALLFIPVAKWAIASIICVPLCFFLAYRVLLRIPLLNKML